MSKCWPICLLVLLAACESPTDTGMQQEQTVPGLAADSSMILRHAQRFGVVWQDGLAHVYVASFADTVGADPVSERSFHYVLEPAILSPEASLAWRKRWPEAQAIQVPVERAVLVSTTHAALFAGLGAYERVAGVAWANNLVDPRYQERLAAGQLRDMQHADDLDMEQILDLDPGIVMTYLTADPAYGDYARLRDLGLPVMLNAEYREPTPLGQAEWVRLAGLLLGLEKQADTLFEGVEQRYHQWQDSAKTFRQKPTVFTGLDWQGSWTVPKGESFAATYLRDAGANYLWADQTGSGNLALDFEAVLDRAGEADFWLHPGAVRTRSAMVQQDPRLRHFAAWEAGRVYNNDARLSPGGGNDYWESAVIRPDRVLRDLVRIFHTQADSSLFYYRRLPENS